MNVIIRTQWCFLNILFYVDTFGSVYTSKGMLTIEQYIYGTHYYMFSSQHCFVFIFLSCWLNLTLCLLCDIGRVLLCVRNHQLQLVKSRKTTIYREFKVSEHELIFFKLQTNIEYIAVDNFDNKSYIMWYICMFL